MWKIEIHDGDDIDTNLTNLWKDWIGYNRLTNANWVEFLMTLENVYDAERYACRTTLIFKSEQDKMFFLLKYS